MSRGCGYRRLDASYHSPAASLSPRVTETDRVDYGYVLGGAVGDEVDRYDSRSEVPNTPMYSGRQPGLATNISS